jgi:hypothetical protein
MTADELAEAQRLARVWATGSGRGERDRYQLAVEAVLTEYNRRGRLLIEAEGALENCNRAYRQQAPIVEAATAVATLWPKVPHEATQEQLFALLDALVAAVEGRE